MNRFYVSTCLDTGRVFICRYGSDNNIAEVFDWNGISAKENAKMIAESINFYLNLQNHKLPDAHDGVR